AFFRHLPLALGGDQGYTALHLLPSARGLEGGFVEANKFAVRVVELASEKRGFVLCIVSFPPEGFDRVGGFIHQRVVLVAKSGREVVVSRRLRVRPVQHGVYRPLLRIVAEYVDHLAGVGGVLAATPGDFAVPRVGMVDHLVAARARLALWFVEVGRLGRGGEGEGRISRDIERVIPPCEPEVLRVPYRRRFGVAYASQIEPS